MIFYSINKSITKIRIWAFLALTTSISNSSWPVNMLPLAMKGPAAMIVFKSSLGSSLTVNELFEFGLSNSSFNSFLNLFESET